MRKEMGYWGYSGKRKQRTNQFRQSPYTLKQSIKAIFVYPSKLRGQWPRFMGSRMRDHSSSGKWGPVQSTGRVQSTISLALGYSNMAELN